MLADFSKYLVLLILFLQILIIFFMGWMRDHASFFSTVSLQATTIQEEQKLRDEIDRLRKQAYLLDHSRYRLHGLPRASGDHISPWKASNSCCN